MEIISNGTTMIWEDDTPLLASEVWECTKCGFTDYEEADNMKHFVDDDSLYSGDSEDIMNQEDDLWTSYDGQNPNPDEELTLRLLSRFTSITIIVRVLLFILPTSSVMMLSRLLTL